ncbi:biotin-dependent carboxyltransferase family protein [Mariniflexile ostreae]|uniref:Biotin-dependent carboxyltransferase family protein n=1 Tax=Mariniflexile ostreae TaxID=1520892 RepID=A0ABV5FB06_9FLAO
MIKVLKSGFYTSIQDLGRVGFLKYGVPRSGAMDLYSAGIANALLGNEGSCAVMEITMTGPVLQFESSTSICISGANLSPKLNQQPVVMNKEVSVVKGDVLSFGVLKFGFRCYMAVLDGFKMDVVMQSQSMYKNITNQSVVAKNDMLPISKSQRFLSKKNALLKIAPAYFETSQIDVFKGPEFNRLSRKQKDLVFSKTFQISKNNNRMAYQLEGFFENSLPSIITSGVLPGTVQLTPSGALIVLMRDCQTTGGYPRILQLKESANNVLAQKFTGHDVHFNLVDAY